MKKSYECIVIGCGGIGSAAVYRLSRVLGEDVLSVEQFGLGHERGSSQDHSRIIRFAYHHPAYARLAPHALRTWEQVEEESGVRLLFETGSLDLESSNDGRTESIGAYADSMRSAEIAFEDLSAHEVMERFPQFRLEENVRAVYQAQGGVVDAGKANAAHVALARARGAKILENSPVRSIQSGSGGVRVETDEATFFCRRLVVAAGAWTNEVLGHIGVQLPIVLTQEQVTYFRTPHLREFALDRFPVWVWHGGRHPSFYGFPVYGEAATKAARDLGDVVTRQTRTFEVNRPMLAELRRFLHHHLPNALGPELYTKTCLYDTTRDREFVLGQLPEHPDISVFVGAGHAFKFASLVGEILAELALEGAPSYPIEAFAVDRPALNDPAHEPTFWT